MTTAPDRLLRIPMRCIDGRWECEYGGLVPVAPDTTAEIVVSSRQINDPAFLKRMTQKGSIRVLEEGTPLLAYLATKEQTKLSDSLKAHLIPWSSLSGQIATEHIDNWSTGGLSLIEVRIGDLTHQQARKFAARQGGLWLITEGPKAVGLQSSRIVLPSGVSDEPVGSLNHAFTRLSEVYEPWRISHTGNVYQRFLYQEKNGRWYPLELLRSAALAETEQAIAHGLWKDFMARMAPAPARPEMS